ncbi:hypothetical protein GH741_00960 [Aquibacillus halophilus]|uniref:Uncharacterized protein n=1 Tax=Aquibacillus halophilus TaxID=930132 RepID=A0A6A8DBK4_9BACI|nr:hypothetical protein [Aquibacillus halophilus]MRH41239.1 hypothetical protein [Aquibacillus halophilus]
MLNLYNWQVLRLVFTQEYFGDVSLPLPMEALGCSVGKLSFTLDTFVVSGAA